jgi:hypothetical protein
MYFQIESYHQLNIKYQSTSLFCTTHRLQIGAQRDCVWIGELTVVVQQLYVSGTVNGRVHLEAEPPIGSLILPSRVAVAIH